MCGNFGRETWRKPWKLRSTGVAVIKTSRRKSTELRLTVIVRFAVMFYLRSKPVCLINRRNDRPSLHRVAWKFDEFQWEFLQGWNSSCARHGIRSMLPSVNLWSERGANTRHGRVIGDRACLRSNVSHSFRGNLYSNCQIRHTSLSASSCGVAAKRWTVEGGTPTDLSPNPSRNVCSMVSQILLSLEKGKWFSTNLLLATLGFSLLTWPRLRDRFAGLAR